MQNKNIGYIICEAPMVEADAKIVSDKGNRVIAEGTLQDVEVKNRNGRFYEKADMTKELKSERTIELLKTGNLKGEDGHPTDTALNVQQAINPLKVCVKYLDIWMEGNDVKAKFK